MKLLAKFNLILLAIFGVGGLVIAQLAYSFLIGNARGEVLRQAQLMMASTESVREYTAKDLSPLLQQNPRHKVRFLPETVPFYGATTTFNNLRKGYPDYSYRKPHSIPPIPKTAPPTGKPTSSTNCATTPVRRRPSAIAALPPALLSILPTPSRQPRTALSATAFPPPRPAPCWPSTAMPTALVGS